jgi:hypothetical protein
MKTFALALIFLAFLAGAFISVLDPRAVAWHFLLPVFVAGVAGLVMHRSAVHAETRSGERLAGNMEVLDNSLDNIRRNLETLCIREQELPVYEARFEIDRLFREDLNRFAEARESMIHVFGMQNYADVMSNFAAGERYINRVWSASADGYRDEVDQYLARARDQFQEADRHYRELRLASASGA